MNRRIVAMILASVVVTGAACSSGKHGTAGRSPTTTTPSPGGSDTSAGAIESATAPIPPGDDNEAVKAAHLHFWMVVDEYGKRTGRLNPVDAKAVLGGVATGGEYEVSSVGGRTNPEDPPCTV